MNFIFFFIGLCVDSYNYFTINKSEIAFSWDLMTWVYI